MTRRKKLWIALLICNFILIIQIATPPLILTIREGEYKPKSINHSKTNNHEKIPQVHHPGSYLFSL